LSSTAHLRGHIKSNRNEKYDDFSGQSSSFIQLKLADIGSSIYDVSDIGNDSFLTCTMNQENN